MKHLIARPLVALPLLMSVSMGAMALDPAMEEDYELKLLGKYLYFDKISKPTRQACASCHTPAAGWTNGSSDINLTQVAVPGADPKTAGNLKPPSNAYASFAMDLEIPCASITAIPSGVCGGNFWNGRAKGNSALITGATGPAANAVDALKELHANGLPFLAGSTQEAWAKYLGPTADQAHASPFINPVEQGLDKTSTCQHVAGQKYAALYDIVWGEPANCNAGDPVNITFARFAVALAAYQHSKDVNAFDSKHDRALAQDADKKFPLDGFTAQENLGHDLFYNASFGGPGPFTELPVTNCSICHNSSGVPLPHASTPGLGKNLALNELGTDPQELFTDMAYHNIGTPRNHEVPGNPAPDNPSVYFLELLTGDSAHRGAVKTPTLRNVDKRPKANFIKAYTRNGWFKSLESLVHFYNTANVNGATAAKFGISRCPEGIVTEKDALANNCWPAPENEGLNAIGPIIGDMGLTAAQEAAIVAYLKTLSDIPTPKAPDPFDLKKFEQGRLQ